jgi:nicotinate-nucleotide adenylyltransferase
VRTVGPSAPVRLPPHAAGMRIGLYGGSFDPPHAGHRHVSLAALRRLRLDRIWWLVTPGNPLKDRRGLPPVAARAAAARALARHPRIAVTAFEAAIGSLYTVDALDYLTRRCAGVRFVWIMGADSLATFHRWKGWRRIAALAPMAVVDRPGWTLRATASKAATRFADRRLPESAAPVLAAASPPAWLYLYGPRSTLSSTALRKQAQNARERGKGSVTNFS